MDATDLECDESILTGESVPADKNPAPVAAGTTLAELSSCLFMGTVVHAGTADAVVVSIGPATQFGRIAVGLGEQQPQTSSSGASPGSRGCWPGSGDPQRHHLRHQHRPRTSGHRRLAVLVGRGRGHHPQLLPAVVSTSLATGSRRLAERKVLVKRLVCIEDLGDIDVLFTDKTGTLTDGRISFERAMAPGGDPDDDVLTLGLVCNEATPSGTGAVGGNPLDVALWEACGGDVGRIAGWRVLSTVPFDHDRRCASVLADRVDRRLLVTKGAPESVLARCGTVPDGARSVLESEFRAGNRVVAVATRDLPGATAVVADDEHDLVLAGFLVFLDQPKPSAAASLERLAGLGITVKIVTGDNPLVAETVCRTLRMPTTGTLDGADLDGLDDDQLAAAVDGATIFARIGPEQKARILQAQRRAGSAVAFLGDGVNDALALHHADVGISVDSATDVAKDAADIILLEQDLDVLADGVAEGRRIFANTIKYVLMGTSSNFGNMFSVTVAAAVPAVPTHAPVPDPAQQPALRHQSDDHPHRPGRPRAAGPAVPLGHRLHPAVHDPFGPISSIFDFATFAVMLRVFHAPPPEFRSGWFVESLATQTLIVFVIRTRRVPFLRSRPSRPLLVSVVAVVVVGTVLPQSPLAHALGFAPLPPAFFGVMVAFVITYLVCVEVAKYFFYRTVATTVDRPLRRSRNRRIDRLAARWTRHQVLAPPAARGPSDHRRQQEVNVR